MPLVRDVCRVGVNRSVDVRLYTSVPTAAAHDPPVPVRPPSDRVGRVVLLGVELDDVLDELHDVGVGAVVAARAVPLVTGDGSGEATQRLEFIVGDRRHRVSLQAGGQATVSSVFDPQVAVMSPPFGVTGRPVVAESHVMPSGEVAGVPEFFQTVR